MVAPRYRSSRMLVQTASVNVDCHKAEWRECFISCIIGCHTPARVVKEDEENRSELHGTSKHNSELCSRIAHHSTARNRHFWRDTADRLEGAHCLPQCSKESLNKFIKGHHREKIGGEEERRKQYFGEIKNEILLFEPPRRFGTATAQRKALIHTTTKNKNKKCTTCQSRVTMV